jgi:hypothetical protein
VGQCWTVIAGYGTVPDSDSRCGTMLDGAGECAMDTMAL